METQAQPKRRVKVAAQGVVLNPGMAVRDARDFSRIGRITSFTSENGATFALLRNPFSGASFFVNAAHLELIDDARFPK